MGVNPTGYESEQVETTLDAGQEIPQPSDIDVLRKNHKEYKDWVWALVKSNL